VLDIAHGNIEEGCNTYTDNLPSYNVLDQEYVHEKVDHSKGEYARWEVHVNTCEAEFSLFRFFMATHRGVAKYNIHLYASLFQLHRELRSMKPESALEKAIRVTLFFVLYYVLRLCTSIPINTNNLRS